MTPPQTTIVSGPGKRLALGGARFSFTSSEAGSTFECKIDGRKPTACKPPRGYSGLGAGKHTFEVWATDGAGNKPAAAARKSFRVPRPT